jgi:3-deoxy-manno-octulosonate cytidylyltransferase (CMP-KDO synthetase)|tara:strand:+ start:42 stop:713 length:672 start_codon:yes stop_codon:yes gene_type:complete
MAMTTAILIPARYNSSRFPGKMMEKLNGVPLVEHVYNICAATGLDTYVLTDHQDIYNYMGANRCLMTQDAENGTERCMQVIDEVLQYDRYINVQGDMPDITEDIIRAVEKELQRSDVSTAYTPMDFNLRSDPNSVKMIHSRGRAHWFLRASLTYGDHHLGVYGYNREAKAMYNASTKYIEEDIEKLEQLRWIQNGMRIGAVEVEFDGIEINTPEDLEKWQIKN